jgi:hypothetical protein
MMNFLEHLSLPAGPWLVLLLVLAVFNLKQLPFAWHVRLQHLSFLTHGGLLTLSS